MRWIKGLRDHLTCQGFVIFDNLVGVIHLSGTVLNLVSGRTDSQNESVIAYYL